MHLCGMDERDSLRVDLVEALKLRDRKPAKVHLEAARTSAETKSMHATKLALQMCEQMRPNTTRYPTC
jgi:hypothetical protein